jgi:hypothetical protein
MGFKYRGNSRQVLKSFSTKEVPEFAEKRIKEAAVHALRMAIQLSPYQTGMFVASWRLSTGTKDSSYASPGQRSDKESAAGESVLSSISAIEGFKLGHTIVLSNSVPHAGFVEYGSPTTPARYITKRVKASVRMRFGGIR